MAQVTGGEAFEKAMLELRTRVISAKEVRVGFLESANYPDSDINVPTVAAINNFGAPEAGIPARPFFTNMVARCSPEWGNRFAGALKATEFDVLAALELMGVAISDELRQEIVDTDSPPNSPVTNVLKQRFPTGQGVTFADVQEARADVAAGETADPGKPLSWSGQMLNSISSEVE